MSQREVLEVAAEDAAAKRGSGRGRGGLLWEREELRPGTQAVSLKAAVVYFVGFLTGGIGKEAVTDKGGKRDGS